MKRASILSIILLIGWCTAHAQMAPTTDQKTSALKMAEDSTNYQKSSALKTLDRDSLDLSQDLDSLHTRMNAIELALKTTGQLLTVPRRAYNQLSALETSLAAADRMLQTAEVTPQTREKAKQLRAQIGPARTKVTAAKVKMGTMASKADPLSEKLLKAAKRLQQADKALVAFNLAALHPEPFATGLAQACVKEGAASVQPCMQRKIDEKAEAIDRVVVEVDRVVEILLTNVGTIEAILPSLSAIDSMMGNLDGFQKLLDPTIAALDDLVEPLRKLDELLGTNLKKCYEVPTSIWTTQRVCTPDISMRVIVEGAGAIMDEIEKVVQGALLEALKWVGLDKIAQAFIDLAQEPLNAVLKALNLDITINLGDIDSIINMEVPFAGIDLEFDSLLPELDVNSPSLGFPGFDSGLSVKSIDLSWFNPGNLAPGDVPVFPCQQGLFLCKDQGETCVANRDGCFDNLVCAVVKTDRPYPGEAPGTPQYRCVGRGSEGDACSPTVRSCEGDLLCRPNYYRLAGSSDRPDYIFYCKPKGNLQQGEGCYSDDPGPCSAGLSCRDTGQRIGGSTGWACVGRGEQNDLCDAGGSPSCGGTLRCRDTGQLTGYACVGRGEQNDLCAKDDDGKGSESCGGTLKCRNTERKSFATWHCVGRGWVGDLCSEEEAEAGSWNCTDKLICRYNNAITVNDDRKIDGGFKCRPR